MSKSFFFFKLLLLLLVGSYRLVFADIDQKALSELDSAVAKNSLSEVKASLNNIFLSENEFTNVDLWIKCSKTFFENKRFYTALLCFERAQELQTEENKPLIWELKKNFSSGLGETLNENEFQFLLERPSIDLRKDQVIPIIAKTANDVFTIKEIYNEVKENRDKKFFPKIHIVSEKDQFQNSFQFYIDEKDDIQSKQKNSDSTNFEPGKNQNFNKEDFKSDSLSYQQYDDNGIRGRMYILKHLDNLIEKTLPEPGEYIPNESGPEFDLSEFRNNL